MPVDSEADGFDNDHLPGVQLSFPWNIDELRQAPNLRGMNQYSMATDDTAEGGGFQYELCPEVFLGRRGYGPLRVAWDTNILIDYAKYGELMWESDEFDPPVKEGRYYKELVALCEIMHLWTLRDIRIKMPFRQIVDASRRRDDETWDLRLWQLEQFHDALACISQDKEITENSHAFDPLPEDSSNDDWDKSLVEEAIATGCHVFLTGDRRLRKRLNQIANDSFIAILPPTEMLDYLGEAGEFSFANFGQYLLPDTHKYTHIMDAHESGYPGYDHN